MTTETVSEAPQEEQVGTIRCRAAGLDALHTRIALSWQARPGEIGHEVQAAVRPARAAAGWRAADHLVTIGHP